MRITIQLDDQLLRDAEQAAAQTDRTLTAVIEDAVRQSLSRPRGAQKPQPIRLIRTGVGGLCPGVDLDHTAELLDLMEPCHPHDGAGRC
jgi:hypothetical protein